MKKMIPPLALVLIFSLILSLCNLYGFAYAGDSDGLAEPSGTDANTAVGDPEDATPPGAAEKPAPQVFPLSSGGTIHGRVTDAATGEGIEDIWIEIWNEDYWEYTYTDEEGYYTLDMFVGAGYEIEVWGRDAGYSNAYPDDITVVEGDVLEYDFALDKLLTITGQVTDADTGEGIEDIWITISNEDYWEYTYTDEEGYYTLDVVVGAGCNLRIWGRDAGYSNVYLDDITVAEDAVLEYDFALDKLLTITGQVTDADTGEGIEDIWISISNEDYWEGTNTDEEGNYTLDVAAGAGYEIWVSGYDAGYSNAYLDDITVAEDAVLEYDFALDKLVFGTITGRVTDAATGESLEDIWITIQNGDYWEDTYTDEEGNYTLDVVVGAGCDLRIWGRDAGYSNVYLDDITVAEDAVLEYDFALDKLLTITGQVTDADTGEGIEGTLISISNEDYGEGTYTDEEGNYTLGVAAGAGYGIRVSGYDAGYFNAYLDDITVNEDAVLEHDFALDKLVFGTITGRVTDTTGESLEDIWITSSNGDYEEDTYTDEEGYYTLDVVVDAGYNLRIWGRDAGYTNVYLDDITVAEDAVLEYDFALDKLLTITGQVTDADTGEGIEDIWISISNEDYWEVTWTGEEGYYTLDVVVGASYEIRVSGYNAGYTNVYLDNITVAEGDVLEYDFTLDKLVFGTITGQVTDAATGRGLEGIEISVSNWDYGDNTYTDEEGYYTLDVVVGAGCNLRIWGRDAGYSNVYLDDITVAEDAVLEYDFALDKLLTITGQVTDADTGEGIEDIRITVENEDYWDDAYTDGEGYYTLYVIAGTGYEIYVCGHYEGYYDSYHYNITVNEDAVLEHDFALDKLVFGTITGQITDAATGRGLEGIGISVNKWDCWENTYTDEEGYYTLSVVAGAGYEIEVWGRDAGYSNASLYNIMVDEGAVPEHDFALDKLVFGTIITGRVTDAATSEGIEDIWVTISNEDYWEGAYTDEEGYYSMDVVAGASYEISVSGYNAGYSNTSLYNIMMDEDAVLEHNFALDKLVFGTITGRVIDTATGAGIYNVLVSVYNGDYHYHTYTNDDGYYSLSVSTGIGYTFAIFGHFRGYSTSLLNNIRIGEGTELEYDFSLEKLIHGTVTGRITDASTGAGIANAWVIVEPEFMITDDILFDTFTDSGGYYSLDVTAGTGYTIVVLAPGFYNNAYRYNVIVEEGVVMKYDLALDDVSVYGTLSGRVTDATTGVGISGIWVRVDNGEHHFETKTGYEGYYSLGVAGGSGYTVEIWGQESGYTNAYCYNVTVEENDVFENIFNLEKLAYGTVSGRVSDAATDKGISGIWVKVDNDDRHFIVQTGYNGYFSLQVEEGSGYSIEIQGQEAGYTTVCLHDIRVDENVVMEYNFALHEFKFDFGDINGDGEINVGDAILLLKHLAGRAVLTGDQQAAADVNGDGKVNIVDAVLILRRVVGLIHGFAGQ